MERFSRLAQAPMPSRDDRPSPIPKLDCCDFGILFWVFDDLG
jgi:hypothetical protein